MLKQALCHIPDILYIFSYRAPQELSNMAYARHLADEQGSVPGSYARHMVANVRQSLPG
jgi:hypothetical protein